MRGGARLSRGSQFNNLGTWWPDQRRSFPNPMGNCGSTALEANESIHHFMYFLLQFMAKGQSQTRAFLSEGAKPMSARFFPFSAAISTGHLHTTKVCMEDRRWAGMRWSESRTLVRVAGSRCRQQYSHSAPAFVLTGINEAKTAPRRSGTFCKFK